MSKNEARRQKQLAKKKAKREEKRTHLARLTSNDPTVRLALASSWPIVDTLVPENLWSSGLGQLVIARRQPDGRLACAVFLLDVFCLGVKNAFWKVLATFEYHELIRDCERGGPLQEVAPEYFSKLLHDAVKYAQAFGFAPHPDYRQARLVLNGIDPSLCPDTFEFGKDGKPFYIRGPHESLEKARSIADRIDEAGGEFIIPLKGPGDNVPVLSDSEVRRIGREESW